MTHNEIYKTESTTEFSQSVVILCLLRTGINFYACLCNYEDVLVLRDEATMTLFKNRFFFFAYITSFSL